MITPDVNSLNTSNQAAVREYLSQNGDTGMQAPHPERYNRIRRIILNELDHGYMVEVGCQSIAIEDTDRLCFLLTKYINNPNSLEQEYNNGTLFKNNK